MPLGSWPMGNRALAKGAPSEARASPGLPAACWVTISSALCVLLASNVCRSQATPVLALQWDAPANCPQSDAVQDRIRALVGDGEVRPELLRAEGRITRNGDKYRLVLIVRSGLSAGFRALESESCEHLTGAVAVGLGLLVRRARTASAPLTSEALGTPPLADTGEAAAPRPDDRKLNPSADGAPNAPPATQSDTTASPSTPHTSKQRPLAPAGRVASSPRNFRILLRGPSVELGLVSLPGVSTGYSMGVGAKFVTWEALFSGAYFPRRSVEDQAPSPGVDVTRYRVQFDLCREWRSGMLAGGPCFQTGFTDVVATGTGSGLVSVESSVLIWSAGVTLDAKLYLASCFGLLLTTSGELQTPRPRFVNKEIGELYRFPLIGLKFGLGSEWLF